jgi:hypothetical protein
VIVANVFDFSLISNKQGCISGKNFAVLQTKNLSGVTERLNETDLTCELKLLAWGQFFLDSFIRCAKQYGVKDIPGV